LAWLKADGNFRERRIGMAHRKLIKERYYLHTNLVLNSRYSVYLMEQGKSRLGGLCCRDPVILFMKFSYGIGIEADTTHMGIPPFDLSVRYRGI
jgi:hypothetical protein